MPMGEMRDEDRLKDPKKCDHGDTQGDYCPECGMYIAGDGMG